MGGRVVAFTDAVVSANGWLPKTGVPASGIANNVRIIMINVTLSVLGCMLFVLDAI